MLWCASPIQIGRCSRRKATPQSPDCAGLSSITFRKDLVGAQTVATDASDGLIPDGKRSLAQVRAESASFPFLPPGIGGFVCRVIRLRLERLPVGVSTSERSTYPTPTVVGTRLS